MTLVKTYISCIIISRGKNMFKLVGTVLKSGPLSRIFLYHEDFHKEGDNRITF